MIISGKWKNGQHISTFQKKFAQYTRVKYAITTSSGRDSLRLILTSLNLKKRDEVILPSYTFHAVPRVVKELGLTPIFVDIDKNTCNINPDLIEDKITKKTKVIIATHLFGRPCDLKKINKIANKNKIYVIEDAAQALGASCLNKKVGSIGIAGFFSLETTKPINTFGGGIITTNNDKLAMDIISKIDSYPFPSLSKLIKKIAISYGEFFLTRSIPFSLLVWPILVITSFFNINWINKYKKSKNVSKKSAYKFTNLQALIGLKQLSSLDLRNNKKIIYAELLSKKLNKTIQVLTDDKNDVNIYYSYVIRCQNKNKVSKKLLFHGIDNYNEIMQDCEKLFNNKISNNTDIIKKTALKIPLHSWFTKSHINYISRSINKIIK